LIDLNFNFGVSSSLVMIIMFTGTHYARTSSKIIFIFLMTPSCFY